MKRKDKEITNINDKIAIFSKDNYPYIINWSGKTIDKTFKNIACADVIILACPLFVYSIPSHTLKMLMELENVIKKEKADSLIMYTVVNCGFYEGKQSNAAFKIIRK